MRLLQTVKYYYPSKGGMETVVQNLVEGIINTTSDIEIIVYSNSHFSSISKKVNIKPRYQTIIEKTPLHFKSQPLNFRFSSLKHLINISDVIHHHFPYPNMEFALIMHKKLLTQKKLIITWHANIDNSRWFFLKNIYEPLIYKLLEIAKFIVVTSPQLYDQSEILKKFKDKVIIVPLCLSSNIKPLFKPRKFPDSRNFRLLFVGKLRKYKGVKFLIESIKELNVSLTIIGNGEEEKDLKSIVNKLNLSHKIKFINNVSNYDLQKFYEKSDLFVLPSINEAEAFGVVQLEAMSNGLPVINTNLKSGVPFVSENGFSGLTVQPSNSQDLKLAIEKIISNKELYENFSYNALLRSKYFSFDNMILSYLNLYVN